jgi:uncharacterized protein
MLNPRLIVLQPTPYCNINCSYCYLRHRDDRRRMGDDVIAAIRDKIFRQLDPAAAPDVVWHAGEPTAVPIAWYERAYGELRPHATPGTTFAMQTNGIAVDARWIALFRETGTRVGVSIDGPQRFHDARRRTRADGPTWAMAVGALRRLQEAGLDPNVISVLHPDGLGVPDEYYRFYREHDVVNVSFSIDEIEGANTTSGFAGTRKDEVVAFLCGLLRLAYADGYMLHVREIERLARALVDGEDVENEQTVAWQVIVVAADGSVSTFSPEFMELRAPAYGDFNFGNILHDDFETIKVNPRFLGAQAEIARGIARCRSDCSYFAVCRGGAPANKMMENGSLASSETLFCRLSTQAAADALLALIGRTAPSGRRGAAEAADRPTRAPVVGGPDRSY